MVFFIYLTQTCLTVLCMSFTIVLCCEDWKGANRNKYLSGRLLESTSPSGPQQCTKRCEARTDCAHINFNFRDLVCEVVAKDDPSTPSQEMEREGYFYKLKRTENTGLCNVLKCNNHSLCYQTKRGLPVCLKFCRLGYTMTSVGMCVKLQNPTTWENANTFCEQNGGRLSVLDTQVKTEEILRIKRRMIWVGGSKVNNSWQWNTGVQVSTGDLWSTVTEVSGPCLALYDDYRGCRCGAVMDSYCVF